MVGFIVSIHFIANYQFSRLEKQRDDIQVEKRRMSDLAGETITKSMESEEVLTQNEF